MTERPERYGKPAKSPLTASTAKKRRKSATDTPTGRQKASTGLRGAQSELELILAHRIEQAGLPAGIPQFRFVPGRLFRFDLAWPDQMVAVEAQGGVWIKGAHSRGSGVQRDCVKFSIAAALGWRVLPVTREMIESGQAVELLRRALEVNPPHGLLIDVCQCATIP